MYKPKSYEEFVTGYNVRGIPDTFSVTKLTGIIDSSSYNNRREPYNLCLKNELDFIPIVNVFASPVAIKSDIGTVEDLGSKIKTIVRSNISGYYKGDLNELVKLLDPSIKQMHETIISEESNSYTPNIPIRGGRNNSVSMRVKTLQDIIDSNNMSNVYTSYKGDNTFLLYPYYYVINDTIVFSMMIKKECISNFRKNWHNLEIDPSHVEVWINKSYLENNDKTSFSKWIKETFLMKLTMQGFVIKVKDDINSEIINLPRIKPVKTIQEMNSLKKAINQMMLS